MARRSDLAAQVKALQAKLAAAEGTIAKQLSELAAAIIAKANLDSELMTEREVNATLSEQGTQLRADLAAATAEITRLRAIIDAGTPPTPAAADLQSQVQQLD